MDIILKLVSESLLSFYPAMVKYIQYPIINQLWARLVIYTIISSFFMTKLSLQLLLSFPGLLLAFTNIFHVWTSYIGFKNLEAGVSYSIFYIYPLLIILFSGSPFRWYYLLPLIGVFLLTYSQWKATAPALKISPTQTKTQTNSRDHQEHNKKFTYGVLGILGATISEAMIYFIVKRLNHNNHNQWTTLFIAYFIPALVVTLILIVTKKIIPQKTTPPTPPTQIPTKNHNLLILLVGNAIIGALGYYLRFYTITRLPSSLYGVLSYFGIVMAYVYGALLNKDKITFPKVLGSLIIIISSLFIGL